MKNKSDFDIYNNNKFNNSLNKNKNIKKELLKQKLDRKNKNKKHVYSLKYTINNSVNELSEIKTEKNNKNNVYYLTKERHLSNSHFPNLLLNKNKFNHRNTFSNITEKSKSKQLYSSPLWRQKYQVKTYSSKNYVNPFATTVYNKKKKYFI